MGNNTVQIIDEVDNSDTLYEDILVPTYGVENADQMLINTKFLRANILNAIKTFADKEKTIFIKEFIKDPIMIYATDNHYDYESANILTTDMVVIPEAIDIETIETQNNKLIKQFPLMIEGLNNKSITKVDWDEYLDTLYNSELEIHKIVIEDAVDILKKWNNTDNTDQKEMIKSYNSEFNISYNKDTFWQEPLDLISKNYWKKLSFVLTINDYDLYDDNNQDYLNVIAEKYFNSGYFDEIVIKINYFYWFDNFQKIIDWTQHNLRSALVSYRFNTIFSNNTKNRYYNDMEAEKFDDIQRKNTILEELEMFETRLPILVDKILINPQTYGFELEGGYFGKEGNIPNVSLESDKFKDYKDIICKILNMSPFSRPNDNIVRIFRDADDKKTFFCLKS